MSFANSKDSAGLRQKRILPPKCFSRKGSDVLEDTPRINVSMLAVPISKIDRIKRRQKSAVETTVTKQTPKYELYEKKLHAFKAEVHTKKENFEKQWYMLEAEEIIEMEAELKQPSKPPKPPLNAFGFGTSTSSRMDPQKYSSQISGISTISGDISSANILTPTKSYKNLINSDTNDPSEALRELKKEHCRLYDIEKEIEEVEKQIKNLRIDKTQSTEKISKTLSNLNQDNEYLVQQRENIHRMYQLGYDALSKVRNENVATQQNYHAKLMKIRDLCGKNWRSNNPVGIHPTDAKSFTKTISDSPHASPNVRTAKVIDPTLTQDTESESMEGQHQEYE